MPWLTYDKGRDPGEIAAQAGMAVHGGSLPGGLLKRENILAQVAPIIQQYLKEKRNNDIANQLMNQYQPPRAEAVDPSMQGAPASQPFTGGAQGLKAYQMYQDMQNSQPDTAMDDLQYRKALADTNLAERRASGDNDALTAYQREALRLREMDINRKAAKAQSKMPLQEAHLGAPEVMGQQTDAAKGTSDNDSVLSDARAAIAKGANPEAVKKRLAEMGVDPSGL